MSEHHQDHQLDPTTAARVYCTRRTAPIFAGILITLVIVAYVQPRPGSLFGQAETKGGNYGFKGPLGSWGRGSRRGAMRMEGHVYPAGIPSVAAYNMASSSDMFKRMEAVQSTFVSDNPTCKAAYQKYYGVDDPLHAWSRVYEYVYHSSAIMSIMGVTYDEQQKTYTGCKPVTVMDAGR
jgi:hypothetical protein